MLADRNAIMGLGDGGAHVGFILDAGYPDLAADVLGPRARALPDRGAGPPADQRYRFGRRPRRPRRLAVGKKADLNVIDYDRLAFGRPYVTYDLPAGGKRLLQKADGYAATIVSGVVTYRDGAATGALPGRLVKGQREAQLLAAE